MNNKYYKLSIAVLVFFVLASAALLFLKNSFSYSDTDLGWHLRLGEDWLAGRQAAGVNQYNYTLSGQKWVDHEWFLNAAMAVIFRAGGFLSLHLVFLFVLILAAFLAWKRSYKLSGGDLSAAISSAFWLFFGLLASRPHLGIRLQEFTLLGLAYLFLLFSNQRSCRLYFWSLPFLFFLWANMHGGFVLGLALFAAYIAYVFLSPLLQRIFRWQAFSWESFDPFYKWQLLLVLIFSLAATLLNPYGLGLYSFLGTYFNTAYMVYIREWQGQFIFPLLYAQIIYLSLSVTAVLLIVWKKKDIVRRLSYWEAFLFLLFLALAIRSRRHFPIFVFVSLPFLAQAFNDLFADFLAWRPFKNKLLPLIAAAVFFLALLVYQVFNIPWRQDGLQDFCGRKYPCAAVDFLKSRPDWSGLRLFNEYDWGGYLLWAYPQRMIFIDGRMPQAEYKGRTILEEYLRFKKNEPDIKNLLDDYQIRLVFLKAAPANLSLSPWEKFIFRIDGSELQSHDPLRSYLDTSPDWQVVFRDNLSIIYKMNED